MRLRRGRFLQGKHNGVYCSACAIATASVEFQQPINVCSEFSEDAQDALYKYLADY